MSSSGLDPSRTIFTGTAARLGRTCSVSPSNSELEYLCYGRILLSPAHSKVDFQTGARETALLCLDGSCRVHVADQIIPIGRYDALYVPRDHAVSIDTDATVDLVEVAAEVEGQYPLQVVRYEDVQRTPSLKFSTGADSTRRELNILIGSNVQAGRLLAGFTRSAPGHWTSWPPHEHGALLEEVYVYFDMPAPAFGLQLVYTDRERPECVHVVRDGDAVLMPRGYHPNVAAPGHGINFVWLMAARREREDRRFGVVNVQPEFAGRGSGLEASQR